MINFNCFILSYCIGTRFSHVVSERTVFVCPVWKSLRQGVCAHVLYVIKQNRKTQTSRSRFCTRTPVCVCVLALKTNKNGSLPEASIATLVTYRFCLYCFSQMCWFWSVVNLKLSSVPLTYCFSSLSIVVKTKHFQKSCCRITI